MSSYNEYPTLNQELRAKIDRKECIKCDDDVPFHSDKIMCETCSEEYRYEQYKQEMISFLIDIDMMLFDFLYEQNRKNIYEVRDKIKKMMEEL